MAHQSTNELNVTYESVSMEIRRVFALLGDGLNFYSKEGVATMCCYAKTVWDAFTEINVACDVAQTFYTLNLAHKLLTEFPQSPSRVEGFNRDDFLYLWATYFLCGRKINTDAVGKDGAACSEFVKKLLLFPPSIALLVLRDIIKERLHLVEDANDKSKLIRMLSDNQFGFTFTPSAV